MPGFTTWDDIVSVQSLSGTTNTREHLKWKLATPPPGSVVRSHLTSYPEIRELLTQRPWRRFFIYRDLRDVAISHARWVLGERRSYLHPVYRDHMKDDDERIMASILGVPLGWPFASNVSRGNIGQDFEKFAGWLDDPDTCAVRFEDLVGARGGGSDEVRYATVRRILDHAGVDLPDEDIPRRFSVQALDPSTSHTFREGRTGGWRERLTPEHRRAFEAVAGELNCRIGYPAD
ncbi:MAG: sulfotransferase [Dehalococcoidia bacterium]|nr:sulfotransferase [Dehalococcoidia bacterium]